MKNQPSFLFGVRMDPVAFHSRLLRFPRGGEPPHRESVCGVSPVPLIPQESSRLPFQSTEFTKLR
ncbi:hypothetical protein [Bacillus badius]|uniref:hypothetical protein n=1 Tax=Bacillus badius TaxID=1455 RepID=UPI0012E7F972|nr:hypothetical protein [Bacillus badius]